MDDETGVELSIMERANSENKGIRPGLLVAIAAIVVALVAAKFLGLFGPKPVEAAGSNPPEAAAPETPPSTGLGGRKPVVVRPKPVTSAVPGTQQAPAPVATVVPEPAPAAGDWSTKLDEVLGSNEVEATKADRLLAIWPTLPPDGQVEVMQHITNLLPDEKFPVLLNTFTNAQTHEEVLDVLMTDVLNRPNGLKLPALLDVARAGGHPKAEEAKDILEVFVDQNYGAEWPKWEKAIQDWLKENPDEAPPEPEQK